VRESVEKELKRRYWWLGVITLVLTSGTVTLVVNAILADARLKLETARAVQELSTDRINKASEDVAKLAEKTAKIQSEFEKRAADAEARFSGLATRGKFLAEELSGSTERTLKVASDLKTQIDALAVVVRDIAQEPAISAAKRLATLSKVDEIQRSLNSSGASIVNATTTVENFQKDFRSVMLGKWTIEKWKNSNGLSRTGILSVDRRTENDGFAGVLTIELGDGRTVIEEVVIRRNGTAVRVDGTVVKGKEHWAPDKFTFELKDGRLIGSLKDDTGMSAEVILKKIL
jgi:hypothetical protein